MISTDILILGAGIAGLGAGYALKQRDYSLLLVEQDNTYGGLCGNFEIDGFRFDRFVHFSFAKDERVISIFNNGAPDIYSHQPNAWNIWKGIWIKHPAQNNLYPLPSEIKEAIVADFLKRPKNVDAASIKNYGQWLRLQFGNYFAENFPIAYTIKYWMTPASELETRWVGSREGSRLYQPSVEEVIKGCNTADTPVTYYSKEMRYPKHGGFKSFLKGLISQLDIRYGNKVVEINPIEKVAVLSNGERVRYNKLVSSLPLPEVVKMLSPTPPSEVLEKAQCLRCTSGYQISVGLKTKNIPPYLWWYIYDSDILPARVYSPSLKSPENAPEGCSSLQMEIYCEKGRYTESELIEGSVGKLVDLGLIDQQDILFTDIRFEPYANVIFDHNIYAARTFVRDYLQAIGIYTIGRFGEWDYLWSDQSLISGLNITDKIV